MTTGLFRALTRGGLPIPLKSICAYRESMSSSSWPSPSGCTWICLNLCLGLWGAPTGGATWFLKKWLIFEGNHQSNYTKKTANKVLISSTGETESQTPKNFRVICVSKLRRTQNHKKTLRKTKFENKVTPFI